MPASKYLLDTIRKLAKEEITGNRKVGQVSNSLLQDLALMNARYKDPSAFLGHHGATSRIKDGWSLEEIAEAYRKMLDSEKTRAIPNFPDRRSSEALILPDNPRSLFSPINPGRIGSVNLSTIFSTENKKLLSHFEELLASREV